MCTALVSLMNQNSFFTSVAALNVFMNIFLPFFCVRNPNIAKNSSKGGLTNAKVYEHSNYDIDEVHFKTDKIPYWLLNVNCVTPSYLTVNVIAERTSPEAVGSTENSVYDDETVRAATFACLSAGQDFVDNRVRYGFIYIPDCHLIMCYCCGSVNEHRLNCRFRRLNDQHVSEEEQLSIPSCENNQITDGELLVSEACCASVLCTSREISAQHNHAEEPRHHNHTGSQTSNSLIPFFSTNIQHRGNFRSQHRLLINNSPASSGSGERDMFVEETVYSLDFVIGRNMNEIDIDALERVPAVQIIREMNYSLDDILAAVNDLASDVNGIPISQIHAEDILKRIFFLENIEKCLNGHITEEDHDLVLKENRALNEDFCCKVCLDKKICIIFECGHMACEDCASQLHHCHICRQEVNSRRNVYWKDLK